MEFHAPGTLVSVPERLVVNALNKMRCFSRKHDDENDVVRVGLEDDFDNQLFLNVPPGEYADKFVEGQEYTVESAIS